MPPAKTVELLSEELKMIARYRSFGSRAYPLKLSQFRWTSILLKLSMG